MKPVSFSGGITQYIPSFQGTRFQGTTVAVATSVTQQIKEERYAVNKLQMLREYAAGKTTETPDADTTLELVKHLVNCWLTPVLGSHITYHEKAFELIKEVATQGLGPLKPANTNLRAAIPQMMDTLITRANDSIELDDLMKTLKEYSHGLGAFQPNPAEIENYYRQLFDNTMGNRRELNGRSKREPEKALQLMKDYAQTPSADSVTVGEFASRLVSQLNYWVANAAATYRSTDDKKLTPLEVIQPYSDGLGNIQPDSALVGTMLSEYVQAGKKSTSYTQDLSAAIEAYAKGFRKLKPNEDLVGQLVLSLFRAQPFHAKPLADAYTQGLGQVKPSPALVQILSILPQIDRNELKGGL